MMQFDEVRQLLSQRKKIVLTNHNNPDGDAMGSALGLCHFLRKLDHEVEVVVPTNYHESLHWLPGNEEVIVAETQLQKAIDLVKDADIVFSLDYNGLDRISFVGKTIEACNAVKIMIDHHLEPENFADYALHDTKSSSTVELVYDFIGMMGGKEMIDVDIATCIYTGLISDTGRFKHALFTRKPFDIAADLYERGIDPTEISRQIFDSFQEKELRFNCYCISQKMTMLMEHHTAYITIDQADMDQFGIDYKTFESGALLAQGMSIRGIKMLVLFIERGGPVKISFRSRGDVNVRDFANRHFDGGGHKNASGGRSDVNVAETVEKFLSVLPELHSSLQEV